MPLSNTPPDSPSPSPETLHARLSQQALQVHEQLQNLPSLPAVIPDSSQELATQLEQALKQYWTGKDATGAPHYKTLAKAMQQSLRDELLLKALDGTLHASYQLCLPSDNTAYADQGVRANAVYLAYDDEAGQLVHGALVFSRDDGPCLLHVPGHGAEGFSSLETLRSQVSQWLNDQVLCSLLLRNTSQAHQDLMADIKADPELGSAAVTQAQLILVPLAEDAFEYAIKQQINKQRHDLAYACNQQDLRQHDMPGWRLGIQGALNMHETLGPAAMLRQRETERSQRLQALREPQWLRLAGPDERRLYLDSLNAYEQARLNLGSMMQGCSSIHEFARSRLANRIQNDLGYAIDPDQLLISTRHLSPLGNEPYPLRRSLSQAGLHGLQYDSQVFEPQLSLDGQPLQDVYPLLTAQWLANTVEQLDLRVQFGKAQRDILADAEIKSMMAEVMRRQLMVQAYAALYQGHIQPSDFVFSDALLGHPAASGIRIEHLRLQQQLMGELLLVRVAGPDAGSQRLILLSRNIPREQQLQCFDNERQLLQELVSWSNSPSLRQYLLEQLPVAHRTGLAQQLLALSNKAQPSTDWLGFVQYSTFDEALQAMTTAHVQVRIDEQRQQTPDWYSSASGAQRQELQALEDAISALSHDYQQRPDIQVPDYERFVKQMASRKINALLGLSDGQVDPDQVIITSPRETLSYTGMLRDGYDDSIGFLNASADTQATFSGPDGVDLSALTPEKVAASVRGAWPSDAWIAHLTATLLNPQNSGYQERRRLSLLITQLQIRSAALHSVLKGELAAPHYTWLKASIDRMGHNDSQSRQRYPVYPLQLRLDNLFIGSDVPALGDILNAAGKVLPGGVSITQLETVQGCFIFCPPGASNARQALLYTPQAPDGLLLRPLTRFIETLQNEGMSDYYKDRCRLAMNRTLAFYFIDLKQRADSQPPALPEQPYDDLHEICYNRVLGRKIRDVQDTASGRSDMIARLAWNTVEMLATALTLPFPPASFAVGAILAVRDSALALKALSEGDRDAASLHVLASLFNTLGAAGDASVGLKGFAPLLRKLTEHGGQNPAMAAARQAQSSPANALKTLQIKAHAPLSRAAPHDPQKLLASGYFSEEQVAGLLRPLTPERTLPGSLQAHQPNRAYVVERSLGGTTPIAAGHAKGVVPLQGHYYITLEGRVYEVQFDARRRLWQIIDPSNPYAFFGKQPVRLTDSGHWRMLDRLQLRGGTGGRFKPLENPPVTPQANPVPSPTSAYELPPQWKIQVIGIADRNWRPMEDYGLDLPTDFFAPVLIPGREVYSGLRENLRNDALRFFEQISLPARPGRPLPSDNLSPDELIKNVFTHSQGMVVSEAPLSVASKQFLIDNMRRLAEQNVEIIYIEHLFTDLHVQKLQKYLAMGNNTATGSAELKNHLYTLNRGQLLNGSRYDHYHLVKAAHRHGIQIKPLSSSVSYDFVHSSAPVISDDPAAMQKMSVFFASRVISSDTAQAPTRRWVALLDHKHANTHRNVPGIAELQGAISIRVQDIDLNQPLRIVNDLPPADAKDIVSLGDLRLEMPTRKAKPGHASQPSTQPTIEPDHLDQALTHLAPSSNPGEHGFRLNEAGQWQRADSATWPTAGEPTAVQRSLVDPLYQIPDEHQQAMHELTFFTHRGLNILYSLDSAPLLPARSLFFKQRARLQRDAQALANQTLAPRPPLPEVSTLASQSELLDTLYAKVSGVIIGESHSSIASKQLIIDNLPHLSRQQVKTLYIEHLQTDMHQLDLDLFAEKGLMSKRLLHYLKHLDRSFFTDPAKTYNFEQLVIKAREHGIEVRALDCMASHYLRNMLNTSPTTRQQMMNYFASRVIRRHQEVMGAHKWIALVGESHANTFKSVPGLAELEQGISVRVFDVAPGASFGPIGDPGRIASNEVGMPKAFVRNDYALGLPVQRKKTTLDDLSSGHYQPLPTPVPIEVKLHSPGLFILEGAESGQPVVIHRSRSNRIERTQVLSNAKGKVYIDRESWTAVHLRPFDSLSALLRALRDMNMTLVN